MSIQPAMPAAPAAPATPGLSAQERAGLDHAMQQVNAVRAAVAQERVAAVQAAAQAAQAGNTSVIRDGNGRIVVTANGKTVTIDPKTGLDGDQIQDMVQTALQPPQPPHQEQFPPELIPIFGIVFPCIAAMVFFVTRMFSARRVPAGSTTAVLPPEAAARLARIEQAVEAVAIEVERISEAQRYSAQLLTERLAGPAPTAPAVAAVRGDHA